MNMEFPNGLKIDFWLKGEFPNGMKIDFWLKGEFPNGMKIDFWLKGEFPNGMKIDFWLKGEFPNGIKIDFWPIWEFPFISEFQFPSVMYATIEIIDFIWVLLNKRKIIIRIYPIIKAYLQWIKFTNQFN